VSSPSGDGATLDAALGAALGVAPFSVLEAGTFTSDEEQPANANEMIRNVISATGTAHSFFAFFIEKCLPVFMVIEINRRDAQFNDRILFHASRGNYGVVFHIRIRYIVEERQGDRNVNLPQYGKISPKFTTILYL
jgi:hypothetical protein